MAIAANAACVGSSASRGVAGSSSCAGVCATTSPENALSDKPPSLSGNGQSNLSSPSLMISSPSFSDRIATGLTNVSNCHSASHSAFVAVSGQSKAASSNGVGTSSSGTPPRPMACS